MSVVDGLGHGPEAARAARAALETLEASALQRVPALVQRCHQSLIPTRGAVLAIASLDITQEALTWLGVGDITGLLLHPIPGRGHEHTFLVSRRGVVGQNLPEVRPTTLTVQPGDTLVFATDGVSRGFPQDIDPSLAPQEMAERILHNHALSTDDALVLVVRYLGGSSES